MYAAERLAKIKRVIKEQKRIDVSTLSRLLGVSEVTVRRDLAKLETQGFLIKTYGGAILSEQVELGDEEDDINPDKQRIGELAANLVKDNDAVFIGPGTTCYYIAKELANKQGLHIVTTNLNVVSLFSKSPSVKLIIVGGDVNPVNNSVVGKLAIENLASLHTNVGFVSVDGMTLERGYVVNDYAQAEIIKAAKANCEHMVVALDKSKFERNGLMVLGESTMFKSVVTNPQIPEAYKAYYFQNSIRLYTTVEVRSDDVGGAS